MPIFLELRTLQFPDTISSSDAGDWLLSVVKQQVLAFDAYKIDECFDNYVRTTGLMILLDGLDEVASLHYPMIETAIISLGDVLSRLSPHNLVVLTMREQFHTQVRRSYSAAFPIVLHVRAFSPSDIYDFLTRWPFHHKQSHHITRIYSDLSDRPTLREMCSNPLVLSMYVAEDQSAEHTITPDSRTQFYRTVIEELVVKRRAAQLGDRRPAAQERTFRYAVLGKLAFQHVMTREESLNTIRWQSALTVVTEVVNCDATEAAAYLRSLMAETGLMSEEKEEETLRFIHLTFCEYLAAHEAVEGREYGWRELTEAYARQATVSGIAAGRLREVIPFAAGLLRRHQLGNAVDDAFGLGDRTLLGRVFLETKCYDHERFVSYVKDQEKALLSIDADELDERWLQDLHFHLVVLADAFQAVARGNRHIEAMGAREEILERILKRGIAQPDALIGAYAEYDATAALRLARLLRLDVVRDAPEVVVMHCDQPLFLALLLEDIPPDSESALDYAEPLVEAALRAPVVALSLHQRDFGGWNGLIEEFSKEQRWFGLAGLQRSLYTELLSVAYAGRMVETSIV